MHGCYVQRFMQKFRVTSYNLLDIKQTEQRTETLIRILGVRPFGNSTSKFHAENRRFLPPRFSMKFSCRESYLPSVKSRDVTCNPTNSIRVCSWSLLEGTSNPARFPQLRTSVFVLQNHHRTCVRSIEPIAKLIFYQIR